MRESLEVAGSVAEALDIGQGWSRVVKGGLGDQRDDGSLGKLNC